MYLPPHFSETDSEQLNALIDSQSLATLVVMTDEGFVASHIPMLREGDHALIGHIALANELHKLVGEGSLVLAVFGAEDSYVSPNWYPGKAARHKVVPTWNYQVVHIHGRIGFQHHEKAKRAIVGRLTSRFERELNGEAAWKMADAPADFMAGQLEALVGVRIEIDRIEAKSKLSQNRAPEDFDSVTAEFDRLGKSALARRMRDLATRRDKTP